MSRLELSSVVVVGLIVSACAVSSQSAATQTASGNAARVDASQAPSSPRGAQDCALTIKQVHVHADMNPELEVAATLDPLAAPYRVWMSGKSGDGSPAAWVSAFGDGWGDSFRIVENAPDGTVTAYGLHTVPGRGWHHAFTQVGTHVIEMTEIEPQARPDGAPEQAKVDGCEATLEFDVSEAVPQVLPTGDCAVIVKQVHRFADVQPELATILDAPLPGAPHRIGMDDEAVDHRPVAAVSVFGENWGTEVHVVETAPDGTVEAYTNASRPRPNQSMTAAFTEVGTHVLELSSTSTDCTATLVFEVTDPA